MCTALYVQGAPVKKIKLFAILLLVVSVVGLGILGGKKVFQFLEGQNSGRAKILPSAFASGTGTEAQNSVQQEPGAIALAAEFPGKTTVSTVAAPAGVQPPASEPVQPAGLAGSPLLPVKSFSEIASGEKWVGYAAEKGVNVRDGPATNSRMLFIVGKGTKGTILDRKNGWSQIKWDFNRKAGWVRDDLLLLGPDEVMRNFVAPDGRLIASFTPDSLKKVTKKAKEMAKNVSVGVARPAPPSETVKGFHGGKLPEEGTILVDSAKLRDEPSTRAAVVGKLVKGVKVKVKALRQVGKYQWFEVSYNNGRKEGWTREDNLQF